MRRPTLSPFGTASRDLAPARPLADLVATLSRTVGRFELGPEHVALALEATTWQPGLDEARARTVLLGVVALLTAQGRGSTRAPLLGETGRVWLRETLAELLAPDGPPGPPGDGPVAEGPAPEERPADVAADAEPAAAAIQALFAPERLPELVGPPGARRPFVLEGEWLYSQRLHVHEVSLVAALAERLAAAVAAPGAAQVEAGLQALRDRPSIVGGRRVTLSTEQETAVRRAAAGPLTVVSGGPGTGKTSIVVSILRLLARLGVESDQVALAAPTGKAAQRMTEAVGGALRAIAAPAPEDERLIAAVPAGQTLHRLLGFSPGRGTFLAHAGNRLEHRVVIVDEASMIDMVLMERLVRAVRADARLVLLGDADQLPSVGAGAVFRDLVPLPAAVVEAPAASGVPAAPAARGPGGPLDTCAVRLTQSYRMDPNDPHGAAILTFARLVNGDALSLPRPAAAAPAVASWRDVLVRRAAVADVLFAGVEALAAPSRSALEAFLARWYAERLEPLRIAAARRYRYRQLAAQGGFDAEDVPHLTGLFRGLEAGRLLCFTRGRRTGTLGVNADLHRLALRGRGVHGAAADHTFLPGEPVVVLANDYDKGLWNGDQGVTLWVAVDGAARPRLMAVFRRGPGFVAFHLELLREKVERCYAMTVHKAQGSEFDHVAVVLPDRDGPLVTREVLYTAVTRARRSVTLVGPDEQLARAAARRTARFSGVRERLDRG